MTQNFDYTMSGECRSGRIDNPQVITSIIVPVNVSTNSTSNSKETCVYKAKKSKRRIKVIKSNIKKLQKIHIAKKKKSHKKRNHQKKRKICSKDKKVRFQNF